METVRKILIVEDEKPLANALKLKLTSSGFEVTTCFNGDDALAELSKNKYDLMLIDIMMPKRDGFSVLEELNQKGNKMPVFVMSNLSQDEDVKRATSLGVDEYIVKSNTPLAKIIEKINTFLSSSK